MIDEHEKNDNVEAVRLWGTIVTHDGKKLNNIERIFLNITNDKYDINNIWNQYFCSNKKYLKKLVATNSFNLLLHGPPGTGKSKFVELVATVLKRHIVSIDLKYCKKEDTHQILHQPKVGGLHRSASDVVFVIEEFDQTVDYLIMKKQLYESKLESMTTSSKDQDIIGYMEKHHIELYLNDLLELFQSSIPREGLIIIATTNNYNKMKHELPALFRPGRLTPLYFSYLDQTSFNELVSYHFPNCVIDEYNKILLPDNHCLPTSQIIEIAKICDGEYEMFCDQMRQIT